MGVLRRITGGGPQGGSPFEVGARFLDLATSNRSGTSSGDWRPDQVFTGLHYLDRLLQHLTLGKQVVVWPRRTRFGPNPLASTAPELRSSTVTTLSAPFDVLEVLVARPCGCSGLGRRVARGEWHRPLSDLLHTMSSPSLRASFDRQSTAPGTRAPSLRFRELDGQLFVERAVSLLHRSDLGRSSRLVPLGVPRPPTTGTTPEAARRPRRTR